MAFWGVFVKPGEPYTLKLDGDQKRLRISQATLGERNDGIWKSRSILGCAVGSKPIVSVCYVSNQFPCCMLDLEFEESEDVVFSVRGARGIHVAGYYVKPHASERATTTRTDDLKINCNGEEEINKAENKKDIKLTEEEEDVGKTGSFTLGGEDNSCNRNDGGNDAFIDACDSLVNTVLQELNATGIYHSQSMLRNISRGKTDPLAGLGEQESNCNDKEISKAENEDTKLTKGGEDLGKTGSFTLGGEDNWNKNDGGNDVSIDGCDINTVLQELNATGNEDMVNNIKQREIGCSADSFLGRADECVSCERESNISATEVIIDDGCDADNMTIKQNNTLHTGFVSDPLNRLGEHESNCNNEEAISKAENEKDRKSTEEEEVLCKTGRFTVGVGEDNSCNKNDGDVLIDGCDILVNTVSQELTATGNEDMAKNIKQQEIGCSADSFLGRSDEHVSCERESNIPATEVIIEDKCDAENMTIKQNNTLHTGIESRGNAVPLNRLGKRESYCSDEEEINKAENEKGRKLSEEEVLCKTGRITVGVGEVNSCKKNDGGNDVLIDGCDILFNTVSQELNAIANEDMVNNIKQQETDCSANSFLGRADEHVSCAMGWKISEEQIKEIVEAGSNLGTLDADVGDFPNIDLQCDKALEARSGSNDMLLEDARNQQSLESTANTGVVGVPDSTLPKHEVSGEVGQKLREKIRYDSSEDMPNDQPSSGVIVEVTCPNNLVQSSDVGSENSKKTKKRKKTNVSKRKSLGDDSARFDNVQEKIERRAATNGNIVQVPPEDHQQKPGCDKSSNGVSEEAARPNDLVQSCDNKSENGQKTEKRKKTKVSKRKSLGEDCAGCENVQEKIERRAAINGNMVQVLPEDNKQKPTCDKPSSGVIVEVACPNNSVQSSDVRSENSQKTKKRKKIKVSNRKSLGEDSAGFDNAQETMDPIAAINGNKVQVLPEDNKQKPTCDKSSNGTSEEVPCPTNLVQSSDSRSKNSRKTVKKKKIKVSKRESLGEDVARFDNVQEKIESGAAINDNMVQVLSEDNIQKSTCDKGNDIYSHKKKKKKIKAGKNVENLHAKSSQLGTSSNDLIIEELAAGEPDGEIAAPGKKVKIFYTARLMVTGYIVQSNVGGAPLKFRIGDDKISMGYNIGVDGMRVGGKRRVIMPPLMGYGKKFLEVVPPDSWVVCDIELVSVR